MKLLFERSRSGRGSTLLPACDVPTVSYDQGLLRAEAPHLPEIAEVDHDTAGDDIVDFNAPLRSARQTSLRHFEMGVVAVSIEHIRLKVHWCQIVRGIGVCPKVVCKFAGVAGKTLIAAIWKFCHYEFRELLLGFSVIGPNLALINIFWAHDAAGE